MMDRPIPQITAINKPFWDACRAARLELQQCENPLCRSYVYYPRVCCPACGGGDLKWSEVSGNGRIASFTKVYRPQHESFQEEVPIYFIAVHLDEGPLMYSRFDDRTVPDEALIGHPVRVTFPEIPGSVRLPYFISAKPV